MTEWITDGQIDEVLLRQRNAGRNETANIIEKLRARVEELTKVRRELEETIKNLVDLCDKKNRKIREYNALREAVLFFVNQTKGRVTDERLAHFASFKRLKELTEDSAQMASNRLPEKWKELIEEPQRGDSERSEDGGGDE